MATICSRKKEKDMGLNPMDLEKGELIYISDIANTVEYLIDRGITGAFDEYIDGKATISYNTWKY